jgi:hypothetical protein
LTEQDEDDASQVGPLLDQIEQEIAQVTADGAYDGEPTYHVIAQRDPLIDVVIPPRVTAQPSTQFKTSPCRPDTHLLLIQSIGRLDWQEVTGYGKRALVETTMGRYKTIIGPRLRARHWPGQQAEAAMAVAVLLQPAGCWTLEIRPHVSCGNVSRCGFGKPQLCPPPCNNAHVLRTARLRVCHVHSRPDHWRGIVFANRVGIDDYKLRILHFKAVSELALVGQDRHQRRCSLSFIVTVLSHWGSSICSALISQEIP